MARVTPLGALVRGLVAGAAGALVQSAFFKAARRYAPATPKDAFAPPEKLQLEETATHTVARRFIEGFMVRGPLTAEQKERAANYVHLGFGAAWGGLYGLARESYPALGSSVGAAGFGTLVWIAGDNVLLPAFRLAARPQAYPPRVHAWALLSHLVYGYGTCAAYETTTRHFWEVVGGTALAVGARARVRFAPPRVGPVRRAVASSYAAMRAATASRPFRTLVEFARA